MLCCLPVGAAAALGLASAGVYLEAARPWLAAFSVVFLAAGFWQQRRARRCGINGGVFSVVLLWVSVVVVAGVIIFPQEISGFIADRSSASRSK